MKKYIVHEDTIRGVGDCYREIFDTAEEAIECAKNTWEDLTDAEHDKYAIFVAEYTEDDIYAEDVFDALKNEDGSLNMSDDRVWYFTGEPHTIIWEAKAE